MHDYIFSFLHRRNIVIYNYRLQVHVPVDLRAENVIQVLVVHLDEELLGLLWVSRHERVMRIHSHVFEICDVLILLFRNLFLDLGCPHLLGFVICNILLFADFLLQFFVRGVIELRADFDLLIRFLRNL